MPRPAGGVPCRADPIRADRPRPHDPVNAAGDCDTRINEVPGTGDFTGAERLFGEALALAGQDGDREAEALAVGGLGMVLHYRNIATLVGGLAPADADVAAGEKLMRRALAIWQEIGVRPRAAVRRCGS